MSGDIQELSRLWVEFAKITQQMIDLAIDEQWQQVTDLGTQRGEIEKKISALPPLTLPSKQLTELIRICYQKNQNLVELARAVKKQFSTEVSRITAGKKAAATYSAL